MEPSLPSSHDIDRQVSKQYEDVTAIRRRWRIGTKLTSVGFIGLGLTNHFVADELWSSPYVIGSGAAAIGVLIAAKAVDRIGQRLQDSQIKYFQQRFEDHNR